MATSSFSHNVVIKDKDAFKALVKAVEVSQKQKNKPVKLSGNVKYADKRWIENNLKNDTLC
ncbi:MAG: hypothetical protein LBC58_07270 [Clostridiales Family XIII bacterium]|jgi:lipopolysaccharide assembly outer membrane protein LptD (OstA)|nr:hypothetical protein [Clostridiales Family XIII bacterium]